MLCEPRETLAGNYVYHSSPPSNEEASSWELMFFAHVAPRVDRSDDDSDVVGRMEHRSSLGGQDGALKGGKVYRAVTLSWTLAILVS
jgi:hypothetical protein